MRTAVFTIASKNYFALVKTLMQSLEKSNPEYDRYVGVADVISDDICAEANGFRLLSIKELDLPEEKKMLFRYNVLELNTAIKPFAFQTLFETLGYDRVIYFDPDIYVYQRLTVLEDIFNKGYEIILTPHLTGQYDDTDGTPNDLDIMKSGVYNLGFLALNKSCNTIDLVHWWGRKLEYQCVASFKDGLFVDQKWMDLVPGMFEKVFILKHSGCNVAYWNLSHRRANIDEEKHWFFNGDPLVFFHFSGLNPEDISNVSKYQNRFNINNIGVLKKLFEEYAQKVISNGYKQFKTIGYSYNYFDDGNYICDLLRKIYREDMQLEKKCGFNPFAAEKVFLSDRNRIFSKMMEKIWYECEDVRMIFPNVNSEEYVLWFLKMAKSEYKVFDGFLEGIEVKDILKLENQARIKTSSKYKLKKFVKQHSSEKMWNRYRKLLKNIWSK